MSDLLRRKINQVILELTLGYERCAFLETAWCRDGIGNQLPPQIAPHD